MAGELTQKTDQTGTVNTYGYDEAGRLTDWSTPTTDTAYGYDADANRTTITTTDLATSTVANTVTNTYDSRDELTQSATSPASGPVSTVNYTYSANGTLATAGAVTAAFDAFGQEVSYNNDSYTYDALGRALTQTTTTVGTGSTSTTTNLTYCGTSNQVVTDGVGTNYTYDPYGKLVAAESAGSATDVWTDQHTDVVGDFTPTGTSLLGTTSYDPLGNILSEAGNASSLHVGYQSGYTATNTGQVNMAARWYSPATGQFSSADTVSNSAVPNPANANPFGYGNADPLTSTDPSGHGGPATDTQQYAEGLADELSTESIFADDFAMWEQELGDIQTGLESDFESEGLPEVEAEPMAVAESGILDAKFELDTDYSRGDLSPRVISSAEARLAGAIQLYDDTLSQFEQATEDGSDDPCDSAANSAECRAAIDALYELEIGGASILAGIDGGAGSDSSGNAGGSGGSGVDTDRHGSDGCSATCQYEQHLHLLQNLSAQGRGSAAPGSTTVAPTTNVNATGPGGLEESNDRRRSGNPTCLNQKPLSGGTFTETPDINGGWTYYGDAGYGGRAELAEVCASKTAPRSNAEKDPSGWTTDLVEWAKELAPNISNPLQRCHLAPSILGGSGLTPLNLAACWWRTNNSLGNMTEFERRARNAVDNSQIVLYWALPIYAGPRSTIPLGFELGFEGTYADGVVGDSSTTYIANDNGGNMPNLGN